jgi:hypothetical protein
MGNQVTSHDSWVKTELKVVKNCWNCKIGQYLVYESDTTKTPRCGQCGELEQDDPAKKPATRRVAKSKEKE